MSETPTPATPEDQTAPVIPASDPANDPASDPSSDDNGAADAGEAATFAAEQAPAPGTPGSDAGNAGASFSAPVEPAPAPATVPGESTGQAHPDTTAPVESPVSVGEMLSEIHRMVTDIHRVVTDVAPAVEQFTRELSTKGIGGLFASMFGGGRR